MLDLLFIRTLTRRTVNTFGSSLCRASDITQSKPHPQMLLEIMEETGVDAENTLMVGDSAIDMQLAHNAGVSGVGVGFGAEPASVLLASGAQACASSWPELVTIIEEMILTPTEQRQ